MLPGIAMTEITFYDYWRSSACYRVRIALNLKGLNYTKIAVDLTRAEHKSEDHKKRHPQAIVPVVNINGENFIQSLAIIEYLDEIHPEPSLMAKDAKGRSRIRALSHVIAMEIHPLCNLSVVDHVESLCGDNDQSKGEMIKLDWMRKFIRSGLGAFETCLDDGRTGKFCHGDRISMADCCLIPQIYNARRWDIDLGKFEKIGAIEKACTRIGAFDDAHPQNNKPA